MTSTYYVNIACYVTKERPEAGFSARETFPVQVEAESLEDARRRVGQVLSEAIAAKDAIAKAIKELDEQTASSGVSGTGAARQGDANVG